MAAVYEQQAGRALEERQLFARYRGSGDRDAHEALVQRFLPLARSLARRYERSNEPLDDLVQVASVGLLKAIDRFDPARAVAFSSFAVPTIVGELKRHFRDKGWWLRVPRDLQELAFRVERVADELTPELGRAPTPDEIAARIGVPVEQVLDARDAAGAYRPRPLDPPRADAEDDWHTIDVFGVEERGYELAETGGHARTTDDRARATVSGSSLRLRFAEDLTQSEIGARVGLSQMHVSRMIRQIVDRLREAAEHETSLA